MAIFYFFSTDPRIIFFVSREGRRGDHLQRVVKGLFNVMRVY